MINEENRARIIDGAIELFNTYGCKAVTMDRLATEMRVSKRTIYETFDSKEALLIECIAKVQGVVCDELRSISRKSDDTLLLTIYILKSKTLQSTRFANILNDAEACYPDMLGKLFSRFSDNFRNSMVGLLSDAQRNGDLRDDADIGVAVDFVDHCLRRGGIGDNTNKANKANTINELCFNYMRGMLSVAAIERYNEKVDSFEKLLANNKQ